MAELISIILGKLENFFPSLCRVCAAPYVGFVMLSILAFIGTETLLVVFAFHEWKDNNYGEW